MRKYSKKVDKEAVKDFAFLIYNGLLDKTQLQYRDGVLTVDGVCGEDEERIEKVLLRCGFVES